MERIKALLAVALFVAGLIFGIPSINPKAELKKNVSGNENKSRVMSNVDSISKTKYILQPVTNYDLVKADE